jgi:para-nitrobenzyl esterase
MLDLRLIRSKASLGPAIFVVAFGLATNVGCVSDEGTVGWDPANEAPVVTTAHGDVRGAANGSSAWVWKGIPFAAPPVDDLRWRAPRDPDPWVGVRHAVEAAQPCIQWSVARTWHPTGEIVGGEDCLYLDVYRPRSEETGLPVFLWIHGGGNNFGSGMRYDGSAMAARSQMVVVVVQFRLGPFGWFRHPSLRDGVDPLDDSGNFGTLDNIKALEWVRDNIAAFGGDPDIVTVAGESAGAHNVTNLLTSPLAAGLFHRAISQSGGLKREETSADTPGDTRSNVTIAAIFDDYDPANPPADLARRLREQPAEDILRARTTGDGGALGNHPAYVDGTVLPGGLLETIESGDYNRVPMILGANQDESKPFLGFWGAGLSQTGFPNNWSMSHDLFLPAFDPDHEWTMEEIFPTEFDRHLYSVAAEYGSRTWRANYVDHVAVVLAAQQEDTWAYLFRWGSRDVVEEPFGFVFGAYHALEIPFFFGGDESLFGYSFTPENEPGRSEVQAAMMAYVARFVRTGDPNGFVELPDWPDGFAELLRWEPWSSETENGSPQRIVFDATLDVAEIAMESGGESWDEIAADLEEEIARWTHEQREAYGWVARIFLW